MFRIIRIAIGCLFLSGAAVAIKKSKAVHKRLLYAAFTGVSLVLTVSLAFWPFENLFITFSSPEQAYEYSNPGKSNMELVIEGDACSFIVDCQNRSDTIWLVPKTAGGWKVGCGSNVKRIAQKLQDGIIIYVYQYKDTNDYFITIMDTDGGACTVSDDYDAKFYSLERANDSLGKTFVTYYAYVPHFSPQYSVVVNGDEILPERA